MKWEPVKIKDIVSGFYDGPHATPEETEEGPVFLGIKNITPDGRLDLTETKHLSEADFIKWTKRVLPRENDIVFSYEATLHRYAIIPKNLTCCLGRRLALLRINDKVADYKFVYYWLLGDVWRGQVESKTIAGSTVDRIPLIEFPNFIIPLPPLPLQRQIAAVLGRYDALLENYQAQVAALEGLAQELYREWFVRGRCPGAPAGPNGELPAGWKVKTLDAVACDSRRIAKIEKIDPDTVYVGLEHLSVKSISIRDTGTADDINSDKLEFAEGDILFGKIRAYLHKVCLSHFSGVCSTDTIVIKPRIDAALGFVLFTVFSEHFIEFADMISNGTKMPRSEWSVLKTYQLVVPTDRELETFDALVRPMLGKIANLQAQITTLRATRDALLPRLLSGQLRINEQLTTSNEQ